MQLIYHLLMDKYLNILKYIRNSFTGVLDLRRNFARTL